jgi:hypothetical protein
MSNVDETGEAGTEVAIELSDAMTAFEKQMKDYYAKREVETTRLTQRVFEIISALEDGTEISVSYEGGGDSGDFYWDGGADSEGNSNAIEQESDRDTVMRCAMSLVNLYHAGWENNEGGGGTVTFRARGIDINHHFYIQETEYESKTIPNPKYEGEAEVTQIVDARAYGEDGTVEFDAAPVAEVRLDLVYVQEMLRREAFNKTMFEGLQRFLQRRNTFFVFQCYTPGFNDGDPCENTISICQFGPGGRVSRWNNFSDDEDEENTEGGGEMTEADEADEAADKTLCTWVSDEFPWLSRLLKVGYTTNVTLFVRVQDGKLVYESSYYDCGY